MRAAPERWYDEGVLTNQDGLARVEGMTLSIVARAGVASKFIAVGSAVPAAPLGVGAIASQAMAKVSYAADVGLDQAHRMDSDLPGECTNIRFWRK